MKNGIFDAIRLILLPSYDRIWDENGGSKIIIFRPSYDRIWDENDGFKIIIFAPSSAW